MKPGIPILNSMFRGALDRGRGRWEGGLIDIHYYNTRYAISTTDEIFHIMK